MGLDIGFAVKLRSKSGIKPAVWLSVNDGYIAQLGTLPEDWHDSYVPDSTMSLLGPETLEAMMAHLKAGLCLEQDRFVRWRGARRLRKFIEKRWAQTRHGELARERVIQLINLCEIAEKYHLGLEVGR